MEKKYLSELISIEEIEKWNNKWGKGKYVVIKAPTGCGKSYMVKNDLYKIAKESNQKILMLVNRACLKKEFNIEITNDNKNDTIDVMTYQTLESFYRNNHMPYDLSKYEYIVCDEAHYFFNDSVFNKYTQVSYDTIENNDKTKIFMSATLDNLIDWFDFKDTPIKKYTIDSNYDYANITFFNKKLYIYDLLRSLKSMDEKCIVFMQDIQLAYEIYQMFKDDALFLCSESNKEYYKYVNSLAIDNMLKNNKFEQLFMISTTVFENGNTLKDKDLNHMIIALNDIESIQQCIGRKRLDDACEDDYLNIAIYNLNNQVLGGLLSKQRRMIEGAELLLSEGEEGYVRQYAREYDSCVYDIYENGQVHKKINSFLYFKCNQLINYYSKWLNDKYHMGFKREIIKMLGKDWNDMYSFNEDDIQGRLSLEEYLEELVEKHLDKSEQIKLAEKIDLKNGKGRLIRSISMLNNYLSEEGFGYRIINKQIRVDGKRVSVWMVYRIAD